ncbi:phosphodiester glycosidase family protein [candidate division KSB1 bacterium]|nr:phosphodiester glycosidase family protein [candidate division KSB1 bacterium]
MKIKLKIFSFLILGLIFLDQSSFAGTIESTPVGPGIIHYHEFRATGPWHINILAIDLANEWLKLETVKANDRLSGYERTSAMAARRDGEGHRIVGAINGDFYGTGGIPVGAQVLDGVLLKDPTTRSIFGVTPQQQPMIDIVSLRGKLNASNDSTIAISGINEARDNNGLVLFNRYFGSKTGTNYWGTEITVAYLTTHHLVNDTIYVVTIAKDSIVAAGHGNNIIPANGMVISGHGTASSFLNENIFVGDTLSLLLQLPPVQQKIIELIGGTPRLIRDGVATVEWENEQCGRSFSYDRHPRTAVGFNQDSTKLYFFTVDGRQPGYSAGMSLFELADYMLEWGVYQGVNLDGGGSTTMVVRNQIVNSPSDAGGERSVANALMVVSTAPTGPLSLLKISPKTVYVLAGNQFQFSVSGFDQYYNPIAISPDSLEWFCDPRVGKIGEKGLFTAGQKQDSGFVYVQSGDIQDSARVYITRVASIELLPNPVILKVGESQSITPTARDDYGNLITLEASEYSWSVTGEIGTVSNQGIFTATNPGQGQVVASHQAIAGSTAVFVGIASDVVIDDFSSASNWSLSGVRINLSGCDFNTDSSLFISNPSSGKLDYSLAAGGTSALYLDCSMQISGSPEAIGIYVYGDGKGHWLRGEFNDIDGEKFLINFTEASPGIDWTNSWKYLRIPLSNAIIHWGNPNAILNFPITWKKLYLAETDDSKKDSGTIFFDDFTAHFIDTKVDENGKSLVPLDFILEQNFPNPFNPDTNITFGLPKDSRVKLEVFNMLGKRIATLLNDEISAGNHSVKFNASQLTSGIYLYRIDTGDFQATKRMVVVK